MESRIKTVDILSILARISTVYTSESEVYKQVKKGLVKMSIQELSSLNVMILHLKRADIPGGIDIPNERRIITAWKWKRRIMFKLKRENHLIIIRKTGGRLITKEELMRKKIMINNSSKKENKKK